MMRSKSPHDKICPACQKPFHADRIDRKTCSAKCKKRMQRNGSQPVIAKDILLETIRQEIGHQEPSAHMLSLGTFCTMDVRRSEEGMDAITALVLRAKSLVGRRILRATAEPADFYDPLGTIYEIKLHLD